MSRRRAFRPRFRGKGKETGQAEHFPSAAAFREAPGLRLSLGFLHGETKPFLAPISLCQRSPPRGFFSISFLFPDEKTEFQIPRDGLAAVRGSTQPCRRRSGSAKGRRTGFPGVGHSAPRSHRFPGSRPAAPLRIAAASERAVRRKPRESFAIPRLPVSGTCRWRWFLGGRRFLGGTVVQSSGLWKLRPLAAVGRLCEEVGRFLQKSSPAVGHAGRLMAEVGWQEKRECSVLTQKVLTAIGDRASKPFVAAAFSCLPPPRLRSC
ncbi:uncharacterized protein LOC142051951 isoform X2 [Phalacrocorax aristotelis]|uniref:uncharacterized protein LOC142051951 isoform X2 n=1 Tax=Phalacrocorax aristotelis TaxID=126867 RepID=UPI003F4BE44E